VLEHWLARQLAPGSDDGCDARIDAIHWRLKYQAPAPGANPAVAGSPPIMLAIDEDRPVANIKRPLEAHWQMIAQNLPGQERSFLRTAVCLPRSCVLCTVRIDHQHWSGLRRHVRSQMD